MWFVPYLRVRRAVITYALIAAGVSLAAIAVHGMSSAVVVNGQPVHLGPVGFSMLFSGSVALVGGLATVLGLNLAAENDGHLEVAWTKPVSREGYALGVFAVDIAAMAVCIVLTTICMTLVVDIVAGYPAVQLDGGWSMVNDVAYAGFPLCVYAWIVALSASLKRNRGTVAAVFWPAMVALGAIAVLPIPSLHALAPVISLIDPIIIFTNSAAAPTPTATYLWGWGLAAVLLVAGVVQWRRLEM
jgi:hypothetical protein